MRSKRELCQNWALYVITDPEGWKGRALTDTVAAAIQGGANVIQLRDKKAEDRHLVEQARLLLKITRPEGVPLIINDRVQVARECGADGVHLGQEDSDLAEARRILGERAIIGRSTHNEDQALEAERLGFDYIGVGPVFKTPTKPGAAPVGLKLVRFASERLRIPFVAIGGIDAANADQLRQAGARTIAVVRAVMAAENPRQAAAELLRRFQAPCEITP